MTLRLLLLQSFIQIHRFGYIKYEYIILINTKLRSIILLLIKLSTTQRSDNKAGHETMNTSLSLGF